jgi:hypothetical protein
MNEYDILVLEREEFENEIYEYLVLPLLIDNSFWDPVVVSLSIDEINNFQTIRSQINLECFICKDNHNIFKNLQCCKNKMCFQCMDNWFSVSVFCPFCKKDQREIF